MWHDCCMSFSIQLADIAEQAARSVGGYLTDAFITPGKVDFKVDFHDVVTVHDKESQRRIVAAIFRELPDSFVVGEESHELLSADGSEHTPGPDDVVWYVDPIDGTSNFAAGFDHWCVSIAAARRGKVVASVIYQPTLGALYRADSRGTTLNGVPTAVLTSPLSENLVATQYPSSRLADPTTMAQLARLIGAARGVRRPGSTALALAEVAAGHFVASFNRHTHPWDVAAGILLVQQAGGLYLGFNDSESHFLTELPTAPNFVAAGNLEAAAQCLRILDRDDLADLLLAEGAPNA